MTQNRVGEKFVNNKGCEMVIVEYGGNRDIWVEFQDEHKARVHTNYCNCQRGKVANPYHPSIYEHGYLGLMSDGSKPKTSDENGKHTREYDVWRRMLERCYSEKLHKKYPSYKDCSVCQRWLCFANFLEDLSLIENYELWLNNDGYALDKDLKQQGIKNKVYSLETCCFITRGENSRERNERCRRI